jgi:hypothetical protein
MLEASLKEEERQEEKRREEKRILLEVKLYWKLWDTQAAAESNNQP